MFKSVRIQNFRQFKDLTLDNLAQINLITGKNDTGKTSLLEAIWLYQAGPVDPGVIQSMARLRGIANVGLEGPSAWGWISHAGPQHDGISINIQDDSGNPGSLRIVTSSSLRAVPAAQAANGSAGQESIVSTASVSARALQLSYTDASGGRYEGYLDVIGRDAIAYPAADVKGRNWYFLAHRPGSPDQEAKILDRLVLSGHEAEIAEAYRLIDERVVSVRSLDPGTGHRIYVQLTDGATLPLSVMGDGLYRMGKIAIAIVEASGGVALIDEVNDGLHYSVLVDVWKNIVTLARRYSVQIFATTHSYECLQAAVEASASFSGGLAMFRLVRVDGRVRVVDVDDEGLRDAISLGFEMR